MNTRIRYVGVAPIRKFKINLQPHDCIGLDELYDIYGEKSGHTGPTQNFLQWIIDTKIGDRNDFVLDYDANDFVVSNMSMSSEEKQVDFDSESDYYNQCYEEEFLYEEEEAQLKPNTTDGASFTVVGGSKIAEEKLSGAAFSIAGQSTTDYQFMDVSADLIDDNSYISTVESKTGSEGYVDVESGKINVNLSKEDAMDYLQKKARAKARFRRASRERRGVETMADKKMPLITDDMPYIPGGGMEMNPGRNHAATPQPPKDYKEYRESLERGAAVQPRGHSNRENYRPGSVITGDSLSRANGGTMGPTVLKPSGKSERAMKSMNPRDLRNPTPRPNTRVHIPTTDATMQEGVVYGGDSMYSPQQVDHIKTHTKNKEAGGQKLRGGNVLGQKQRSSIASLRKPTTVQDIVSSSNEKEAAGYIQSCSDTKVLKVSQKLLRERGLHNRADQIDFRLHQLPPGF